MPTLVVPGGPVVVVVSARRAKRNYYILVFIFFDIIFCILLLLKEKSSFFALKKSSKKKTPQFFSLRFFFACRASRERKRLHAKNDDMPKQRAVVVLPFVACVVSALVFARPARGFYLPGVAPQGTSYAHTSSSGVYYYLSTRFCCV